MAIIGRLNRFGHHLLFMMIMAGVFCGISLAQDVASHDQKGDPSNIHSRALQSVNIEITSHLGDQQNFVEQDVISFFISLDRAAYLYGFYQDASGDVYQLIPGKAQAEHYFQPGFYIPFPAEDSAFQFVVQAPFGEEQIWLFASDQGQLKFKGRESRQGIKRLNQRRRDLAGSIKAASRRLFGEAHLIIHTRSR